MSNGDVDHVTDFENTNVGKPFVVIGFEDATFSVEADIVVTDSDVASGVNNSENH